MKTIKLALAALLSSIVIFAPAAVMAENIGGNLCSGANFETIDAQSSGQACDETAGGTRLQDLAIAIVNIFSWIIGVVAVIMIIWGGFKYITSSGNDSAVTSAKNTILYAIIGLVIVALAQVIVRFVVSRFSQPG